MKQEIHSLRHASLFSRRFFTFGYVSSSITEKGPEWRLLPPSSHGKRIVYGHVQYLSGCEMLGFCSDLEGADMQWDEFFFHRLLIAPGEHEEERNVKFPSEGLHDEGVPPG